MTNQVNRGSLLLQRGRGPAIRGWFGFYGLPVKRLNGRRDIRKTTLSCQWMFLFRCKFWKPIRDGWCQRSRCGAARQTLLSSSFFVLFGHPFTVLSPLSFGRWVTQTERTERIGKRFDRQHPQWGDNSQIYLKSHQNRNQGWPPFSSCCAGFWVVGFFQWHNRGLASLVVCRVWSITLKVIHGNVKLWQIWNKKGPYLFKVLFAGSSDSETILFLLPTVNDELNCLIPNITQEAFFHSGWICATWKQVCVKWRETKIVIRHRKSLILDSGWKTPTRLATVVPFLLKYTLFAPHQLMKMNLTGPKSQIKFYSTFHDNLT